MAEEFSRKRTAMVKFPKSPSFVPLAGTQVLGLARRLPSLLDSTSYHGDVRYRVGTLFDPGDTKPFFRRGILTLLAIPLGAVSFLWARAVLEFTFYDSMGVRLAPGPLHLLWSGMWAVLPLALALFMIYVDWKKPKRSK
jgi:hypothetical protein